MTERPWLILTLRRTGGTSLTSFLASVSSFPSIEHEPFNKARTLGHITQDFRQTGDAEVMRASIVDALAKRPNIKHCVEILPLELTRTLIDVCMEKGYRFIVLTRRDEARRLASLFLAQSTGAWGPVDAARIYPEIIKGDMVPKPIDLSKIEGRVRTDYYSMGRTLSLLRNRRIEHPWYLFEELYFGDIPIEKQALAIAADLGVTISEVDPRLQAFARRDGQKSSEIAQYVPNFDEAMRRLRQLCAI